MYDGLTQYVILGAGLDSFAYRSELTTRIRVFEVDHPTTQDWKRKRLSDVHVDVPDTVAFVPIDLECESFAAGLVAAGFDTGRPALVSWLGVTMYLTRAAIGETFALLAGFASGTEVIVDYMVPAGLRDAAGDAYVELVMPAAAERGEPWLSFFSPGELSELIRESGLEPIEHVRQRDAVDPALWDRSDSLKPSELCRLARARVSGLREPSRARPARRPAPRW